MIVVLILTTTDQHASVSIDNPLIHIHSKLDLNEQTHLKFLLPVLIIKIKLYFQCQNIRKLACQIGFYGKNCSDECPAGTYGPLCSKSCKCPSEQVMMHMDAFQVIHLFQK